MRLSGCSWLLALVLIGLTAGSASAQYNVPASATGDPSRLIIAEDVTPTPSAKSTLGYELGASLDFLTTDRAAGMPALKFTDVVLFRVHGLLALGTRAELFAGVDLLPKQPSYTDELVWQGAMLGVRQLLGRTFSGYARAQLGPGLERDGAWLIGEAAAQAKLHLAEKVLFWESTLGGTYTQLFPDEEARDQLWQAELLAQTGIAIREKRGTFATWLTFSFHFPLIARPRPGDPDPISMRALDPQTRVGVSFGMLAGVTRALDFFVELSILDRGDLEDPRTTLPILAGGFDQNRILFGFNRRFGTRRR